MTRPWLERALTSAIYPCFVLLMGCSGGDASDAAGPANLSGECHYSDALAGSVSCVVVSNFWQESFDTTLAIGQSVASATGEQEPLINFDFGFYGRPTEGTFIGGQDGAMCSVGLFEEVGGASWGASSVKSQPGECSFSLSSVSLASEQTVESEGMPSLLRTYVLHGSFSATLEATQGGAEGQIEFDAFF